MSEYHLCSEEITVSGHIYLQKTDDYVLITLTNARVPHISTLKRTVRVIIDDLFASNVPTKDCTKIKRHITSEMFLVKDDGTIDVNICLHYNEDLENIWSKFTKLHGKPCEININPVFVRYLQDTCPYTKTKVWRYRLFWSLTRFKKVSCAPSIQDDVVVIDEEIEALHKRIASLPTDFEVITGKAEVKRDQMSEHLDVLQKAKILVSRGLDLDTLACDLDELSFYMGEAKQKFERYQVDDSDANIEDVFLALEQLSVKVET